MEKIEKKKENGFLQLFDALFILLLCFGTLLSAMLMQGDTISGMKYSINYATFLGMVISLVVYVFMVLVYSEKGLKVMIKALYVNDHNI